MVIKIGPAGLGPINTAKEVLDKYNKIGFKCCEIEFTYSIYIKNKKHAKEIGKYAKKLGVDLSIHAPYWLNLNSVEKEKIEKTKERILKCCEIGNWIGAKTVVFHPGYYGKDREGAYDKIKEGIKEMIEEIKKNEWNINLAPECMGKINVFGSVEEISKLAKETGCSFCIDFAHILARNGGKIDMDKINKLFPQKKWHCHFSGIIYGEKGEKRHKSTKKQEWKNLLDKLPKNKDILIINESPTMIKDCVDGLEILKKIKGL